jgi:hypothetical protein
MSLTRRFVNFMLLASSLAIPYSFANNAFAEPGDLYQVHGPNDAGTRGFVFKFTGGACSEAGCPWKVIDTRKQLYSLKAVGGVLYGIEAGTNSIWRYYDQPAGCPTMDNCPGWTKIDANSYTNELFAGGGKLYQRHANGSVYEHTGTPPGWEFLFRTTNTLAVGDGVFYEMTTSPYRIYRRNRNDLQLIDNNQAARRIFASGPNLYRVTYNGLISTFTGQLCHGDDCSRSWRDIEDPDGEVGVVRTGRNRLLNDTRVMYYTRHGKIQIAGLSQMIGAAAQPLDLDPNVTSIAAGGTKLYKRLLNGEIYQHDDRSPLGCGYQDECKREWTKIDANPTATELIAEAE